MTLARSRRCRRRTLARLPARRRSDRPERNGAHGAVWPAVDHEVTLSVLRTLASTSRVRQVVRGERAPDRARSSISHRWLQDYWREPGRHTSSLRSRPACRVRDAVRRGVRWQRRDVEALVRASRWRARRGRLEGVQHGWVTLDNVFVDEGGDRCSLTNFVVCPSTVGHDVADLAGVVRACVARCDPDSLECRALAVRSTHRLADVDVTMVDFVAAGRGRCLRPRVHIEAAVARAESVQGSSRVRRVGCRRLPRSRTTSSANCSRGSRRGAIPG